MPIPSAPPTAVRTDVVVVGAGPAGLFQLFQLGLLGLRCHALDALPHPGGQCRELYPDKPIYDIPALLQVNGAQLAEQLHQQLAPFAIQWHWGHTVQAIDTVVHTPDATGQDENGQDENGAAGWLRVRASTGLGQPGALIEARAVVLALGPGAFTPRIPKIDGLDALLQAGTQAFVQSHDSHAPIAQLRVAIYGGDEAAVHKALELAQLPEPQRPAQLLLLHRRDVFRADANALAQLQALRDAGRIHVITGQITALALDTQARLHALRILTPEGQDATLALDTLLLYQGITPKLGAALDWGLALDAKHIVVDPATMQTSRSGIYAIGDIARYSGKRKLIACGFHEAIVCAFAIAQHIQGQPVATQYTTTSTQLLQRLGR